MVEVMVDKSATAILGPLKEQAVLINADGRVLGYFTPLFSPEDELRRKAFSEYDPEKARRRRESPEGGFTTEQVKAHLNSLRKS